MRPAFRRTLLRKYDVQYSQCQSCGFLQSESPYWLEEAYSNAIAAADTGLMQRNLYLLKAASVVFWRLFHGEGKFLDAAGGYGIFTRLMRDVGFDYYWSDPYTENLVARGFEGGAQGAPYCAISAFEVLEHVQDPMAFLASLTSMGAKTLLVSTELFVGNYPDPDEWWYYAFDTGQHISFYRRTTMELIGQKLGLNFLSQGSLHMWTDRPVSALQFRLMTHPKSAALLSWIPRLQLKSRVWSDHLGQLKS
jgi:methyltransferase family protein